MSGKCRTRASVPATLVTKFLCTSDMYFSNVSMKSDDCAAFKYNLKHLALDEKTTCLGRCDVSPFTGKLGGVVKGGEVGHTRWNGRVRIEKLSWDVHWTSSNTTYTQSLLVTIHNI